MRIRHLSVVAAIALVAACGEAALSPSPNTVEPTTAPPSVDAGQDLLTGPWRPAPFTVEPNVVEAIEFVCKNPADPDLKAAIEQVPVAFVDARGDSFVSMILADENVAFECRVRTEMIGGELTTTILQPPTRLVPDATLPAGEGTIRVISHNRVEDGGSRTILIGRVGSDAAKVLVGFPDESEVEASMSGGWYAAWWPGVDEPNAIAAVDRRSVSIEGVDAPQTEVEGRVRPAAWWLDPAAAPLSPDTTTIPALITERDCASGQSPEGRVVEPVVFSGADAVLVNVWVRLPDGGPNQDCPSNPEFPLEITLPEPLGDRRLLDGSEVPPRDATGPPN